MLKKRVRIIAFAPVVPPRDPQPNNTHPPFPPPPPLQAKELATKAASKSYREKVEAVNVLLSTMPEHNDIPKISYAGLG